MNDLAETPRIFEKEGVIRTPQLGKTSAFLQIWSDMADHRRFPLYKDFSPEDLPNQLWKNLFITSVDHDPFKVKFLYQGMYITDQLGQHFAGLEMSKDLFGDAFDEIEKLYLQTYEEKQPVLSRELVTSKSGISTLNEVIHVPFFDNEGKVCHICGAIETLDIPETTTDITEDSPENWHVEYAGLVESRH